MDSVGSPKCNLRNGILDANSGVYPELTACHLLRQYPRAQWVSVATDSNDQGRPAGMANVETTSLAVLALEGMK
jgi:hypothetical protein